MEDIKNYQRDHTLQHPDQIMYLNSPVMGEPTVTENPYLVYKNPYGGRLPIGSKRLQEREERRRRIVFASKFMFVGGAVGLIMISALRFSVVNSNSLHSAIMNFYYLFFGIIVGFTQIGLQRVIDNFRFLNYHWGRCLFSLFLASLSFSNKEEIFIQYILTIYWLGCAAIFLFLSYYDKRHDDEQYKHDCIIIKTIGRSALRSDERNDFEKLPYVKNFKHWIDDKMDYGSINSSNQKIHKKEKVDRKKSAGYNVKEALNSSF